jgi:hypothetical protein
MLVKCDVSDRFPGLLSPVFLKERLNVILIAITINLAIIAHLARFALEEKGVFWTGERAVAR